ncbi:TlpA disulfide reductase family protein [Peribacillus sp. JNUCC 23]|uniref:TlpA disulfide reductase family protein n=1 Tax=Peribacillus sp. NPDC096379 TaxID=3364393 RepID=UPI000784D169
MKKLCYTILSVWIGLIAANSYVSAEELTGSRQTQPVVKIGKPAPNFELTTLSGEQIKLSDYRGKVVILNLWATWCPPCKAEMPEMQSFYEKSRNSDITLLSVNLTAQEKNEKAVADFVANYQLTFPILLDKTDTVGKLYKTISIPTSYIIDREGIIREKVIGPMDEEKMAILAHGAS